MSNDDGKRSTNPPSPTQAQHDAVNDAIRRYGNDSEAARLAENARVRGPENVQQLGHGRTSKAPAPDPSRQVESVRERHQRLQDARMLTAGRVRNPVTGVYEYKPSSAMDRTGSEVE